MTTGDHLEALRRMLIRLLFVVLALTVTLFIFKAQIFQIVLSPRNSDFVFYSVAESLFNFLGVDYHFKDFGIELISTELSSQFVLHMSTSLYLAVLLASPYILTEVFLYISPALYDNEKRYAVPICIVSYLLFGIGVLMTYYVLFPFSLRFLGTYQVDPTVTNTITLSSYISTMTSMSLVMGLVFQLPMLAYILGKLGIISSTLLIDGRKWALMIILTVSAIITPPDLFTLFMVALPLFALYEVSIVVLKKVNP